MRIISIPGLRVVYMESDRAVVEHPVTGACYSLDPPTAGLLQLLETPEEIESLSGEGGPIPRSVVEHLLSVGLLVDASAPYAGARNLLRRVQPTFMNCPEGDPATASVCVIGMPADALSDTGVGAAAGPASLRHASAIPGYGLDMTTGRPTGCYDYYSGRHILEGVTFADLGDVPVYVGEPPSEAGARLRETVRSCLHAGGFPVILGGDHSLTAWSVEAFSGQPVSVLHLDAHSDLGTSPTGTTPTNGSVVRSLLRQEDVGLLLSVGVRGMLPVRQESAREGHLIIPAREARRMKAEEIVALLPESSPCYVTLDLDVLDPSIAPGTNTPVPDGLLFEDARALLEEVGRRRRVVGVDIVELNPARDPYQLTARAAVHLALSLLGSCFETEESLSL